MSCGNSKGEGYGEISQRDGKTVPHAVAEYFSAEFIIHNYNPHLSVRRLWAHLLYYSAHPDQRKGVKLMYIATFFT